MSSRRWGRLWGFVGVALAAGLAAGSSVQALAPAGEWTAGVLGEDADDLAVVKRAVAQSPQAERAEPAKPARKGEGRWLRVRINENGGKKRVSVNLPMAFVRVLDDFPIDYDCGREGRRRCTLRLAEILDALDQGEDLVTIDDEDTKVRVWIE